jgi:TetR/AcrR family transcriptional regulator, mexCD-oprJ operon repressor
MSTTAPSLRDRVAAAILDAAASVLARPGGERASMHDVALAAGLARATVYRYFPNRQALLDELARGAVREAGDRLADARLDEVSVEESLARAVRALAAVGDRLVIVERERVRPEPAEFEHAVVEPLSRLFERGRAAGEIRTDVPTSSLGESLVGLVVSVLRSAPSLGVEATTAMVTSLFLDGARARPGPPAA